MAFCTSIAQRTASTTELDKRAVAGALDHAPVVNRNRWVDKVAPRRPQARQRPILIGTGEAAEANHVGDEDRSKLPLLSHASSLSRSHYHADNKKRAFCG
jgi:hypothetical protein